MEGKKKFIVHLGSEPREEKLVSTTFALLYTHNTHGGDNRALGAAAAKYSSFRAIGQGKQSRRAALITPALDMLIFGGD